MVEPEAGRAADELISVIHTYDRSLAIHVVKLLLFWKRGRRQQKLDSDK